MVADNQILRVTYEAFSRFSNNLDRCRTLDEIGTSLKTHLKYLFNFHVFRANYRWRETCYTIVVTKDIATVTVSNKETTLPFEQVLIEKKRPVQWSEFAACGLPEIYNIEDDTDLKLGGWYFSNEDEREMVLSIFSGVNKPFTQRDVTFLKLLEDCLQSKLLELCLFKELEERKRQLEDAFYTISEKNEEITAIVDQQNEIIHERTREIEEKNENLLQISVMNAHNIREPLSRILGLINLLKYEDATVIQTELVPHLETSANDLDHALKEIINMATKDLVLLKA